MKSGDRHTVLFKRQAYNILGSQIDYSVNIVSAGGRSEPLPRLDFENDFKWEADDSDHHRVCVEEKFRHNQVFNGLGWCV